MPVVLADASTLFNKAASRFAGLPPFTSGYKGFPICQGKSIPNQLPSAIDL
jgi:hypothetical protein